jgi:tetratricopeptide (TPR) repeat protein
MPSWLKITDFGLAKHLNEETGRTAAGTVMGSPSYMPPEQAKGQVDLMGPRSDVYSLGAILYELLTGRPPFRAATAVETLSQVTTEEPVPPSRLQPKLPRDLETICLKCLQKDPNKRYASAKLLGADLRRFYGREPILARPISPLGRGWRWCRRNPAIASLAAGLAAVVLFALFGLTWLYLDAESQRHLAELNASVARAEEHEAAEQRQLAEANATKAQAEERKAAASLADNAKMLAAYLSQHGEYAKAESNLRQALALRIRLAKESPDQPEQQIELAIVYNNLANLLEDTARSPEAETTYREALNLLEAMARQFPNDEKNQRVLAVCLNNLGNFLTGQCRYTDAEAAFRRVLPLQQALTDKFPNIAEYGWELGNSYANMGMMLTSAGRAEEALPWLEKGIARLEQILDRNNRLTTAQQFLSLAHANRARALRQLNRAAESIADWDQAILLGEGGNRPRFQAERAQAMAKAGDLSKALAELTALEKRQNLNTTTAYEIARLAALCAANPDDEPAARAVDWLNRIAALDYFRKPGNCQRLHRESDFDKLRSRSDFRDLLDRWPE